MNLNPIASNMNEVEIDGARVLFSYRTPVAALVREETPEGVKWHQYKTAKNWSRTTSRHISKWNPLGGAYGVRPQEWFDALLFGIGADHRKLVQIARVAAINYEDRILSAKEEGEADIVAHYKACLKEVREVLK